MSNTFSLKNLTEGNAVAYIAPFLILGSLFHILDPNPGKHQFGQLELLGAFILNGYYLWAQIVHVYSADKVGRKRIEAVVCMVVGVFSAMLLMAPLLTWQYVMLYRSGNRAYYAKPIAIAIATLWIGTAVFYYGSYKFNLDRMQAAAANAGLQESSMPTPSPLPQATQ